MGFWGDAVPELVWDAGSLSAKLDANGLRFRVFGFLNPKP